MSAASALPALETTPIVDLLDDHFARIDEHLGLQGLQVPRGIHDRGLYHPLRDFLARPGKELRARLVRHAFELAPRPQRFGVRPAEMPPELPLLVEMLHAGSLVVDDIEDGALVRRDAPALHRVYGVPTALNAGNWLYFWPATILQRLELPETAELEMHRRVSRTLLRCHHGQALDISLRLSDVSREQVAPTVRALTTLKTGELFRLSAELGAFAARSDEWTAGEMGDFGASLGVGLQMLDDLGSVLSRRRRHKGREDVRGGRLTWAWAVLAEEVPETTWRSLEATAAGVERGEGDPDALLERMSALLAPIGRQRVQTHLEETMRLLRRAVGPSANVDELTHDLTQLERAYVY